MSVADNLASIQERIRSAEERAGRAAGSVKLLAVSKFHPASAVLEAISAGQRLFGENRVQEAEEKFPSILAEHPDVTLHMIGSLQRNKVKQAVRLASCIQSVDRAELLAEIEKQAADQGKIVDVLFEYHTGEDSKSGYPDRPSLFASIDALASMPHVRPRGLMTMAPFTDDKNAVRGSFRELVRVQHDCLTRYPGLDFSVLSMGMSADYEIAIEEGSTLVRVGTAIFGERA
jgi:pyridoxal phosphate enzyme (YggS family)